MLSEVMEETEKIEKNLRKLARLRGELSQVGIDLKKHGLSK